MMGIEERDFGPLPPVSLEDLIPGSLLSAPGAHTRPGLRPRSGQGHVRRHRSALDPPGRLWQLIFFEGLRSEHQLLRVVADRLSLRWSLGYDLTEPHPDHSSLTRLRERYGLQVFRRFFEAIVEQCVAAGLVWGQELFVDSTDGEGTAAHASLRPRRRCPAR